jgi:hypothetical protein
MNISAIEAKFRETVNQKITLRPEGMDRYHIFTPFMFNDGDHLVTLLKKSARGWAITDEGHTFMHLSYDLDMRVLETGTRQSMIGSALSMFGIQDADGELLIPIENEAYGDALYNFIQGLIKIADVKYLSRERVRSAFMEDFKAFLSEKIPEQRRKFDFFDMQHDPEAKYPVDCRIGNGQRPLFVFAVPSEDKCRDVTISCLQYEKWGIPFRSMAIYENQEEINRKVVARFSDVCEKQYSSLNANKDRIGKYFEEFLNQSI